MTSEVTDFMAGKKQLRENKSRFLFSSFNVPCVTPFHPPLSSPCAGVAMVSHDAFVFNFCYSLPSPSPQHPAHPHTPITFHALSCTLTHTCSLTLLVPLSLMHSVHISQSH